MAYCPNCKSEYEEGTEECVDCNIKLIRGKPKYCENCDELLPVKAEFCPHCGYLFIEILCANHKDRNAIGVCIICGRALCDSCIDEKDDKLFCEDDFHKQVYEEYAVAMKVGLEIEAIMIRDYLREAGVNAQVFSQKDRAFGLTVGELSDVKIMVPKNRLLDAEELLKDMEDTTGLP